MPLNAADNPGYTLSGGGDDYVWPLRSTDVGTSGMIGAIGFPRIVGLDDWSPHVTALVEIGSGANFREGVGRVAAVR
jgi:hypothetical protein